LGGKIEDAWTKPTEVPEQGGLNGSTHCGAVKEMLLAAPVFKHCELAVHAWSGKGILYFTTSFAHACTVGGGGATTPLAGRSSDAAFASAAAAGHSRRSCPKGRERSTNRWLLSARRFQHGVNGCLQRRRGFWVCIHDGLDKESAEQG